MIARNLSLSALALASACGWALPAAAQDADPAAIQQELAAMRAQMAEMAARMETLQARLDQATTKADAAQAAVAAIEAAPVPETQVSWKGAPEFKAEGGWTFKPRGRLQIDAGTASSPAGITNDGLGFGSEIRRGRA